MIGLRVGIRVLLAAVIVVVGGTVSFAQQGGWKISKISGDVWISSGGVQKASLGTDSVVQAGDDVRTGRNGRLLLTRGEESILVSPNSALAIPQSSKDGMSTTITQQAGSALFQVEKRNVQHFSVETPFLAAVVKGTEFRVSVTTTGSNVRVSHGAVDVSDFKTGQHVVVMPGQSAQVAFGQQGLRVNGPGVKNPIQQGTPRTPGVNALKVPKGGFTAPRASAAAAKANGGKEMRAVNASARTFGSVERGHGGGLRGTRITAPIGDVKLDFNKVTGGLARANEAPRVGAGNGGQNNGNGAGNNATVWAATNAGNSLDKPERGVNGNAGGNGGGLAIGVGGGNAGGNGGGGGGGSGGGGGGAAASASIVSAAAASGGNAGGNGNGNAYGVGNGNGNGNGGGLLGTVGGVVGGVTGGLNGLLHRH